jgi:transcriptional regulator with XRE-family HTH domain
MNDSAVIGARVREARKRRGLTQRELARQSGVSLSLITKLEQGEYGGVRLETVHRLAVALRVTTSTLAARDAPEPAPESVARWEPVRRALDELASPEPDEEPTLEGVQAGSRRLVRHFRDSRFAEMETELPALLRDADSLVSCSVDGMQATARSVRGRVRVIAGSLMIQAWQFDAAERAFAKAMEDAGDELAAVCIEEERCFGLIRQGRLTDAAWLAIQRADDAEPGRISVAARDDLAAWGRLLLWAAMAAARDNRPREAEEMIRLAQIATAGADRDFTLAYAPWHRFGPATVAITRAENAAICERPAVVLTIGGELDRQGVGRSYIRHRLDVAHAYAMLRQFPEAVTVLRELRQSAPEWLACQRYAADIMRRVVQRRRTLTAEMREMADFLNLTL